MAVALHTRKVGVRKGEILDAALTLFCERGYTDTGMEDIAAAVGVAPSSLYNHWRSKQELLQHIMVTTCSELLDAFETATADAASAVDALSAAMDSYVRYHVTHKRGARVSLRERSSLDADAEATIEALHGAYAELWQDVISRGVNEGQFEVRSTPLATYALLEIGIGVSQWIDKVTPLSIDEIASAYVEMALRLVGYRP